MTNGEYQKKQHRGSTPSAQIELNFRRSAPAGVPPEEWKNLTWYPSSPESPLKAQGRSAHPKAT